MSTKFRNPPSSALTRFDCTLKARSTLRECSLASVGSLSSSRLKKSSVLGPTPVNAKFCDSPLSSLISISPVGVMLVVAANNRPIPSFPSVYASVISVASHDSTDPYRFYYNPDPPVEFGAWGVDVPIVPLDHLVSDIPRVALLKIDVEGYEKAVLDGAVVQVGKRRFRRFRRSADGGPGGG